MKPQDAFALLGDIDEDLILDAIPAAWLGGAQPPKHRRMAGVYDRFMSSGVVAALLSVVVALSLLGGIVFFMRGNSIGRPPAGEVTDAETVGLTGESPMSTETGADVLPAPELVWIVRDGEALINISSNSNVVAKEATGLLSTQVVRMTGASIAVTPDGAIDLVCASDLEKDSYRIQVKDDKIILEANTETGFVDAVERLLQDAAVEGGLALPPDYRVEDGVLYLWIVRDDRSDICIVDSGGVCGEAPQYLADRIRKMSGVTLSVVVGAEVDAEGTIQFSIASDVGPNGYRMAVEGSRVCIAAASPTGFERAINQFLTDAGAGNGIRIPQDYKVEEYDDAVWLYLEGNAEFVVEEASWADWAGELAELLVEEVEDNTIATLPIVASDTPVDHERYIRFIHADDLGTDGFRIAVEGADIFFYATERAGFERAVQRFRADAETVGGLAVPSDYRVEEPSLAYITADSLRAAADQALAELFPELSAIDLSAFRYSESQNQWSEDTYFVTYDFTLCGMHTSEDYRLTVIRLSEGRYHVRKYSSSWAGQYSRYHESCTTEMLEAAQHQLSEESGAPINELAAYWELGDNGELILCTEQIVSITQPSDSEFPGGCGIDHEHRFYTVVVCP